MRLATVPTALAITMLFSAAAPASSGSEPKASITDIEAKDDPLGYVICGLSFDLFGQADRKHPKSPAPKSDYGTVAANPAPPDMSMANGQAGDSSS